MGNSNKAEFKSIRKQLNAENKSLLDKISSYIYSNGVNILTCDEINLDVASMMLEAQNRGEDAKQLLGDDFKKFGDELIANSPRKRWYEQLIEACFIGSLAAMIILVMVYVSCLITQSATSLTDGFWILSDANKLTVIVTGGLVGGFASIFAQKHSLGKNKLQYVIHFMIIIIVIAFIRTALTHLLSESGTFRINLLIGEVIMGGLALVSGIGRQMTARQQLRKKATM